MSNPPSAPPEPRRFSGAGAIAFGLLVGSVASFSLFVACCLHSGGSRVPIASITALLLLCVKRAFDARAAWTGAPRTPVVSALSLLAMAPLFYLGAVHAMDEDLIVASHRPCGTGEAALATCAPLAAFPLATLGASFAAVAVGCERTGVDALLRGARIGVLALAGILLAFALGRALHKPDPEHYLASLPKVGVIPPESGDPIAIIPGYGSATLETRIYEDHLRDIVVRRECSSRRCEVLVHSADPAVPSDAPLWESWWRKGVSPGSRLTVRRDEKHDLWVLGEVRGEQLAFRGRGFEPIDIDVNTVADGLSSPLGWILGAGIGLLIGGMSTVRRRRVARRAAAIADAALGVHDQNGWVTVDDGGPAFRAVPDLALPVGPVLILRRNTARWEGGPYRGTRMAGDSEILAGGREAHLAPLRCKMAELDAFALSALVLTAAPLGAALMRGLVF